MIRRRLELAGLEGAERIRVQLRHREEDGYDRHEAALLFAADLLDGWPEGALYEHEAWLRRWRREGVLSRELFRDGRLWLASEWTRLDPEQPTAV